MRSSWVEPGERVGVGVEGLSVRFFSMPEVVVVYCQARIVVAWGADGFGVVGGAEGENILVEGGNELMCGGLIRGGDGVEETD